MPYVIAQPGKTAERAVLEGFAAVEDMFRAIGGYHIISTYRPNQIFDPVF